MTLLIAVVLSQALTPSHPTNLTGAALDGILISTGGVPGVSAVSKFGRNPDIDTATVPEDVWAAGGLCTGFPLSADGGALR